MALGLLQSPTLVPRVNTRDNASTQLQVHNGERISTSFSSELDSSDIFSRFPDKKNRKVSLVTVRQNCAFKWLRKQRRNGDRVLEFSRQPLMLKHYPTSISLSFSSGALESRNVGIEKQIMLTKVTKNLVKLGQKKPGSGAQHYQEQRNACVSASTRGSQDPSPSDRDGQRAKLFFAAVGSAALSAKGRQMWKESVLKSIRTGGDFAAGKRDGGGGGGGGEGGGGGNGDGNGNFESGSNESLVSDLAENADSQEDDQPPILEAAYRKRRIRVFASLSSAAGDAIDGEAPFGDPPSGRNKRSGSGEEVDPLAKHVQFLGPLSGANMPRKGPNESLENHPSGSAGGVVGMLGKNAQDCFNFLSPNHDTVKSHQKQPGVSKLTGLQGSSNGGGPSNSGQEALVEGAATRAMQLMEEKVGDEALAKRSETAALRRLQREAFSDLLKARERLDKLEFHTGLRHSKTASAFGESTGAGKTRLKGEVSAGGAFVLLDNSTSRYSRAALEQAGLHTGLNVRFTFETTCRDKDVMITECSAGHAGSDGSTLGGPISVTKIVYNAQVTDDLNFVVAPLGACSTDMTEIVNPLQGQALSEFARVGPALYNHCIGSALGATLRGNSALLSLSQYLSDWGNGSNFIGGPAHTGPLCLSTLAQILFQPWENSVFSLSAVNRFWPSPPLPSSTGLHWSEMGPLVLSKTIRDRRPGASSPLYESPRSVQTSIDNPSGLAANASWGTPYGEADRGSLIVPESHGTAMQSVAVAGEIDVGANMSLGGWAQVERGDWLQESDKRDMQWGVSIAKSLGRTAGWGVCVGSSKIDLWGISRSEENGFPGALDDGIGEACGSQLQVEAFLKLSMGRGFTMQPGLVYLLNKHSQTPAFMLRSSWTL